MKTLKTFGIYLLLIVGFFVLSNFLIFLGLNSNYEKIQNRNEIPSQIEIIKAEGTNANVRIKGRIKDIDELTNEYLKIDLFSNVGTSMGTYYFSISDIKKENEDGTFKEYINAEFVTEYNISIVENK